MLEHSHGRFGWRGQDRLCQDVNLPGNGRQWPLGNIQVLGKSNAEAMRGEEPHLTKLARFFPSIGAVNPALTAMANAVRVGEHVAGRLG